MSEITSLLVRFGWGTDISGCQRLIPILCPGKSVRPTVTFSPHPRHHPFRSDARVSTSLRTIGRQSSYIYTPKGPEPDRADANPDPESPTRTPRPGDTLLTSASTPKSILKRNRQIPIRVAASVEEGTRGNAEELRQSGRKARPVLQIRDSFAINKDRSNPIGNATSNTLAGVSATGSQGFRDAEVPSSDHTNTSEDDANKPGQSRDDEAPSGDREEGQEGNEDANPLDVEMVQLVSSPSSIDSLLEIILNELDDLLAVEDAYLLLFARLKKCFAINEDTETLGRSAEQQQEREDILRNVRSHTSEVFRALTRDIKRLVQPASNETRFLGSSSPIPHTTDPPATPSPSPQEAAGSDNEDTPKPRRQGYSEAEVRERRAAAGVGQAALKVLSFIGYHQELHEHFSEADLTSLLSTTLVIPATPKLNTPNSKRTYAFAIYVLSLLRVPSACLIPISGKILQALLNATGEFGMQFWRGSQAKDGPAGGNVKAKMEGYSAIWNVCRYYPSIFLPYHKDLVPEIIKGIVHGNPQVRARASAAAGGFAKGKLIWLRESRASLRDIVEAGQSEDESDEQWTSRRLEAEKRWKVARDVAAESEATTVVSRYNTTSGYNSSALTSFFAIATTETWIESALRPRGRSPDGRLGRSGKNAHADHDQRPALVVRFLGMSCDLAGRRLHQRLSTLQVHAAHHPCELCEGGIVEHDSTFMLTVPVSLPIVRLR